jgi:hypothetical protein
MLPVVYLHPCQFQASIMKASVIYMYIITNMAMVKTYDQWKLFTDIDQ